MPSELPLAAEPGVEGQPASGVDYVSLAAERTGAGRSRRARGQNWSATACTRTMQKRLSASWGRSRDRQRRKRVSLLTVTVGGALAVVGLAAFLACRIHVPPYRVPLRDGPAGFALAGLALFGCARRLKIKPPRVNPCYLIAVWEGPQ